MLRGFWHKAEMNKDWSVADDFHDYMSPIEELIDEAKALAKGKSLVAPGYTTYRDYLKHFRYECERVGIHAFHGHRHFYAQTRYKELTGRECPARGGPTSKQLTSKQKAIDREAREVISGEMGHGREQITAVYLGSSVVMRRKVARCPPAVDADDRDST